jgi:hypothetical protein
MYEMTLNLKCESSEFNKFKSGTIDTIIVVGTQKQCNLASDIRLGHLVTVSNCASKEELTYRISGYARYLGACTLDDVKKRHGLQGNAKSENESVYLAPEDRYPLYEGIYVIKIQES